MLLKPLQFAYSCHLGQLDGCLSEVMANKEAALFLLELLSPYLRSLLAPVENAEQRAEGARALQFLRAVLSEKRSVLPTLERAVKRKSVQPSTAFSILAPGMSIPAALLQPQSATAAAAAAGPTAEPDADFPGSAYNYFVAEMLSSLSCDAIKPPVTPPARPCLAPPPPPLAYGSVRRGPGRGRFRSRASTSPRTPSTCS